ncbi:MAG: type VI secretion system tip protein VgrG [Fibrobacterales bacterium]
MSSADTTIYRLTVSGLPEDQFTVLSFSGIEEVAIGYSYKVVAISNETDLSYDELIGIQTSFEVKIADEAILHHGIITEIDEEPFIDNRAQYTLTIEPKHSLLKYTTQSRIFQEMSVQEIVQEVLEGAGLTSNDFSFELNGSYDPLEFTAQYNESDFNFIQRLMEYNGIYYFFDHEGDSEILKICDDNAAFGEMQLEAQLRYQPNADMVTPELNTVRSINRQRKMVTGKVTMKDYNYSQPETNIFGTAEADVGVGEFYQFADTMGTTDQANSLATLRKEMLVCRKDVIRIRSSCHQIKSGYQCTIDDDGIYGFDSDYLVLRVEHRGSQEASVLGEGAATGYMNVFHCIDASVTFRPMFTVKKPKIEGLMTVKVDGPEDDYAYLDDTGRYKVKMPYDLSDASDGTASLPVRLSQPYSGSNYGMHFPVHMGCDLVIGFENGDIDKPIAVGTAPNPSQSSPVSSANKSESIIKTASGHQFRMDDLEDKTKIDLMTTGGHNLEFNDDAEMQQIKITSTGEHQVLIDDTNEMIIINTKENKSTITMDNPNEFTSIETATGHLIKMDDANELIAIQSGAGHAIQIHDGDGLITLQDADGSHVIQIDASGTISVTTSGDIEMKADGAINMDGDEVNITGHSAVNITSDMGDVAIEGMNLNAKSSAGDVAIEAAMNANLKGGMNLALEGGLNLEAKAGLEGKFTGTMVTTEGSAMMTVKGGLVMIN